MAIDVQEPHEMSALIDTQTRKLRAQLLGAMVCREAGEPAPQRLHLRRAVEPKEPAERGRVAFLEMLGPLNAEQRHEQERQQGRAQSIEGRTDFTVELAADPKQPALDQTWDEDLLAIELHMPCRQVGGVKPRPAGVSRAARLASAS